MGETDARLRGGPDLTAASHPTAPAKDPAALRDAASVILLRRDGDAPRVLMGQRGAAAAFLPSKYVFPGGGVDPADHAAALPAGLIADRCLSRLALSPATDPAPAPTALAQAALRELAEETGLTLSATAPAPALRFVFRAITPPGRPRRFDARFFLIDAACLSGDPDDLSQAGDELSHLHWIALTGARALDLPFITEVVLAELDHLLTGAPDEGVPFFDNSGPVPIFRRL